MSECLNVQDKKNTWVYPDETISFSWNVAKVFDIYHIVMYFPYQ